MSTVKKLIPLLDRILIKTIKPKERSVGGVLIPEGNGKSDNFGKVIAIGPGLRDRDGHLQPPAVKEGDQVLLPEYGGTVIKLDGEEYKIYRDSELLAIIGG
jgi:chaperonin GroES